MLSDELCRSADLLYAGCEHGSQQIIPIQKYGIPLFVKGRNVTARRVREAEHAQKRTMNLLACLEQE